MSFSSDIRRGRDEWYFSSDTFDYFKVYLDRAFMKDVLRRCYIDLNNAVVKLYSANVRGYYNAPE